MFGAIAGDIIGSVYEWKNEKHKNFPLFSSLSKFTDDSVLTVAIAESLLSEQSYTYTVRTYGLKYPNAGYGGKFKEWLSQEDPYPYNSWGNGSAMRVSPVGWLKETKKGTLKVAEQTAIITHNHPEGVKGAKAVALAIWLARTGEEKATIKAAIENTFDYDLSRKLDDIRPTYEFDVSCQGSVPEAIIAFLESSDFEDAIRNAISIGGDSDTIACITGGIAEAYYKGVPEGILVEVRKRLPNELLMVADKFCDLHVKHQ